MLEDAKMAAQTGADAIIVSNHGGRQLDGASSTINIFYLKYQMLKLVNLMRDTS